MDGLRLRWERGRCEMEVTTRNFEMPRFLGLYQHVNS